MKKVIICCIPFKPEIDKVIYKGMDETMPAAEREVRFPVNALLDAKINKDDEVKVIVLVKKDKKNFYERNKQRFLDELLQVTEALQVNVQVESIYTDFAETQVVHSALLDELVDKIEDNSYVLADITYGPKDEPIVLFAALKFAEKHLNCDIDIIYGLAQFENGHVVDGTICNMSPLFYLSSVSDAIECSNTDVARRMLKALISI